MRLLFYRVPTLFLSCLVVLYHKTIAYETCSTDTGNGVCPDGNTCCLMRDGSSGCISSDMGEHNASCCRDEVTGCAVGYNCRQKHYDCFAASTKTMNDPLIRVLPRYRLCKAPEIKTVFGLSLGAARLAYYSSHGPIENINTNASSIDMALIMVHGANRNADDYFCSALAAVGLQTRFSNVLLVAPRFFSEIDTRPDDSFLYWKEDDGQGPWRYGANALSPAKTSSYTALDVLVDAVWEHFPNLKKMTIAGHSSGGQMIQRWTLLTSSWITGRMHSVVANPSSYAYLTPFRFIRGDWILPNDDNDEENDFCPQYNQWEWGLEGGGNLNVPYKDHALNTNVSHDVLISRFLNRRVLYLAGNLDRCNISTTTVDSARSSPLWCNSHGLETSCMDEMQGSNRLERSEHYITSLRRLGIWGEHIRRVVHDVGHDHSLMFQSTEGLEALFETKSETVAPLQVMVD